MMFRAIWLGFASSWKRLVFTDLLFKLIAYVLLTPLVGLLFHAFLALSGRTILADVDIALFMMHPLGWLTGVLVGGSVVGILALEQSVLIVVVLCANHSQVIGVQSVFRFIAGKLLGIFLIAAQAVLKLLLLAAPFLAISGGLYFLLLTKHDINFYLSEKPPVFWIASISIGVILATFAVLGIRLLINWSIAIPLHLFEQTPSNRCLSLSQERLRTCQRRIAIWISQWIVLTTLFSSLATSLVIWIARTIAPSLTGSLWQLAIALGVVLIIWAVVNLFISMFAVISLAILQGEIYNRYGKGEHFHLPKTEESDQSGWIKLTPMRVIAGGLLCLVVGTLVGVLAIQTVRLEDDVEITAHRGGATHAPENTLAAIRQAIEDQTDWVEIDVQESKDGVVVVVHDSDLKKVAGEELKIWEGTADELRSIDIGSYFDPGFRNERVPTLEEVLQVCRDRVGVNIELKYYGHDKDLERKVVDLVEQNGMSSNVVVMSLEAAGIAKIKSLRPHWTVGLLTATAIGDLTRAEADFLAVNANLASRRFIDQAHRKHKAVHVWTVNDPITMSSMISRGADNLITDNPHLARQVLDERGKLTMLERVLVDFGLRLGIVPTTSSEQ